MLEAIRSCFEEHIAPGGRDAHRDEKQRVRIAVTLIEHLWRVGYADGSLHRFEDHLIRKVADLIHVPHNDLIATRLRVRGDA